MIEVTRINGTKLTVNAEMLEFIEETPDTVLTMSTGTKLIVAESSDEIREMVIAYKRKIFSSN